MNTITGIDRSLYEVIIFSLSVDIHIQVDPTCSEETTCLDETAAGEPEPVTT